MSLNVKHFIMKMKHLKIKHADTIDVQDRQYGEGDGTRNTGLLVSESRKLDPLIPS